MALAGWQKAMYKDSVTFYKPVLDAHGNTTGYTVRSGPYPCNYQRTPNFDVHSSDAGSSKEDNIFTANGCRLQYDAVFDALDLALITSRLFDSQWMSIKGAVQQRQLLAYATFYGVPTNAPVIV
jgi:hypothetical protein